MTLPPIPRNSPAQIQKKQRAYLLVGLVIIAIILAGIYLGGSSQNPSSATANTDEDLTAIPASASHTDPHSHTPASVSNNANFSTDITQVDAATIWVERAQNALAKQAKTTEQLQLQLQKLTAEKAGEIQSQTQVTQSLQSELKALKQQVSQLAVQAQSHSSATTAEPVNIPMPQSVQQDLLSLSSPIVPIRPSKTPSSYVPAGTFVRAVLLGGADASAGINSQGNPTPVLLRLLDEGTLPNQRHSRLKDCMATAAAVGDISSERGQMRLERLSCVSPRGEIIDLAVEGTVFGSEGKNGVRGIPVWKEGAMLQRTWMAGALSGLSSGIAQQYTSTALNPYGGSTATVNSTDVFKYGAAQGASSALDKLADYHIQRAEQYHPVIQVSAGTIVDIVFLKGFYLDGLNHTDKTDTVLPPFAPLSTAVGNTASPSSSLDPSESNPNMASPETLPLTPEQIAVLQQSGNQTSAVSQEMP